MGVADCGVGGVGVGARRTQFELRPQSRLRLD